MIIRCSNCSGALVYDIALGKMKCAHCNAFFEVDEVETSAFEEDMMEYNIFACTACGAKVAVNNVECATWCAYCGQPTIVFERVSKRKKPKKIIPFRVTKEEAEAVIRKHLKMGFFVPKAVKEFEVERLNGVYMPYWLFDVEYKDRPFFEVKRRNGHYKYQVCATTNFKNLTMDASENFSNLYSQRLEPYDMKELTDFKEEYLSGIYADCFDVNKEQLREKVFERCKKMYDNEISKNNLGSNCHSTTPKWKVLEEKYAMLPVWFLTMRYKDKSYTMLVNGQTKKVMGAVPYVKWKVVVVYLLVLAVLLLIVPGLSCKWFQYAADNGNWILMFGIVFGVVVSFLAFFMGEIMRTGVNRDICHTSGRKITRLNEIRQEVDE